MDLQNFPSHTQSLSLEKWQALFDLLPEIENTQTFGILSSSTESQPGVFTFPYWCWGPIVERWLNVVEKLDLMPVFDWSAWEEGNLILKNPDPDFSKLNIITLCMLFTTIVLKERFCDGYLVSCFEYNTIPEIIKSIKDHVAYKDQYKFGI